MKKSLILLVIVFGIYKLSISQTVTFIATTNGIAPIPAFALGQPAGIILLDTKLGKHFNFSPDLAYSLKDGSFWFADLWFRYHTNTDSLKKWNFIVGVSYPSFTSGSAVSLAGKKVFTTSIYPIGQLSLERKIGKNDLLILDYWYLRAVDMTTGIKGSYISLLYSYNKTFEKLSLSAHPNLFYLNYSDGTNGFVMSIDVKLSHNKSGLFLARQEIYSLGATGVNPVSNFSLGISRKMF